MKEHIFQVFILLVVPLFVTLATFHELRITRIALQYMTHQRRREVLAGWVLTVLAVSLIAVGVSQFLYLPGSWKIGAATVGMFSGALFFLIAANQFIKHLSLD